MDSRGLHLDFYFFQYKGEHHNYLLMIGGVLILNGMELPGGTPLCYFLMHFVCSNINIIPFLFSTAGPSIGTKRSVFVPLCNSSLWEEDTCIVFIVWIK